MLRLAAVIESSDDAIISEGLDGRIETWNRAAERIFGYTAAEAIGRSIDIILPPERRATDRNVVARLRAGEAIDHFETTATARDGTAIPLSVTMSSVTTPDGEVIGISRIARDMSQQLRLAREAEEANRVKDEFLAMLSHELRTPLNAVLGYTRMLRMGHFGEGQTDRAIDIIDRNATILSQLVSDVLDVSSIVTGKIRLNLAPCDLTGVIEAAVDVVRPSADAKGVALHVEPPAGPVIVQCDKDRLQQVFWNLLSNAVKFTPRGGQVKVAMEIEDRAAKVSVADTGIGIRSESLPYLFQRFWQAEGLERQNRGSLGLGLALARHFIELHGGTIHASSEGEGRGATFTIRLPAA
jgi:PAS domain S-box-containing protein